MKIRVKLNDAMAGDHGNHAPGVEVALPIHVAAQVIARRHGVAIDPLPDDLEAALGKVPPPFEIPRPEPIDPPLSFPAPARSFPLLSAIAPSPAPVVEAPAPAPEPEAEPEPEGEAVEGWGAETVEQLEGTKPKKAKAK